jgi:hypothetical protein
MPLSRERSGNSVGSWHNLDAARRLQPLTTMGSCAGFDDIAKAIASFSGEILKHLPLRIVVHNPLQLVVRNAIRQLADLPDSLFRIRGVEDKLPHAIRRDCAGVQGFVRDSQVTRDGIFDLVKWRDHL